MEITLSICGTTGCKEDGKKLTRQHFDAACSVARALIEQINDSNYVLTHLVSGGAAYMDHIAVKLFLEHIVPHLRLFLPDLWENGSYHFTSDKDPYNNPGGIANYYHELFRRKTGINSLSDIQIAQAEGAELIDRNKYGNILGFYARNALVAKSDFILACTFGQEHMLKDDGTADTVRKYLDRVRKEGIFDKSFHFNLTDGKVYEGCQVPPQKNDGEKMEKLARRIAMYSPLQKIRQKATTLKGVDEWRTI